MPPRCGGLCGPAGSPCAGAAAARSVWSATREDGFKKNCTLGCCQLSIMSWVFFIIFISVIVIALLPKKSVFGSHLAA